FDANGVADPRVELSTRPAPSSGRDQSLSRSAARRLLERDDVYLVVASEGDLPIGFALAYELPRRDDDGTMLFVHELAVRKGRRREGLGRKLVDALWEVARRRHVTQGFVLTKESNEAAMAFFSGLGDT